jgi:microcompartment protein CcmK/EutM
MFLAKVVGTLVATQKEASLDGLKFLVVRRLDGDGRETDSFTVAADAVGAGLDEVVHGRHRQLRPPDPPHRESAVRRG